MHQKNMKIATIAIGSLVAITFIALMFITNRAIRVSVKTVVPQVTKTPVKLKSAKLSIFTGKGELNELVIGNPDGFDSPFAIAAKNVKLNVDTTSFFSKNIVINWILVDGAEITYEVSGKGSNINAIMKNIASLSKEIPGNEQGGPINDPPDIGTNKRVYIKNLVFRNGTIKVKSNKLNDETITLPLPLIERKDIGNAPQEIKGIKNKSIRKKRSEKMRAISVPEMAKKLFGIISDTVVSTVETSGILGFAKKTD